MLWFGIKRMLTSILRWIFSVGTSVISKGHVLLSPPFFRRQLIFSLDSFDFTFLRINSYYDWATIHEIFVRREYDSRKFSVHGQIIAYYEELTKETIPLILDLGANIGVAAAYISRQFPEARIVAVEPASRNIALLKENTSKVSAIRVLHAAVGAESGAMSLFDPGVGNNAFRAFGSDSEYLETVPGITINEIVSDNPDCVPFLVKIDVEGFEKELFSRNTSWVDFFKVIVVETHDWMLPGQAVSSNLLAALGGKKRDLIFQGENLFSVRV
jgi:FkbM family methyltransferase